MSAGAVRDPADTPLTPESWGKLGMWLFLAGDAMSFGGLLAGYGALRAGATDWPKPDTILGIPLTSAMTFLLICSSVTMVYSLSAIKKGEQKRAIKYMAATVFGGILFLGCQAYEWIELIYHKGVLFHENPFGSGLFGTTFYSITGFHGGHVTGGVIYLGIILLGMMSGKITKDNASVVEIAGLYWHFVDLVWILVFTFVYLI